MRMHKSVLYVLFPAFLCYYVAVAHASLQKDALAGPSSAFSQMRLRMPRLAVPACLTDTVKRGMDGLRQAVTEAGLMRDSRPSPEQARRDFVALWKDLDPARHAVPTPAGPAFSILLPGQD
ncbi:hypothetical protein [Solidesulfovibrio sp.]|uniref:hypothetical protein n=1 Tax=Solidesulfovibrio sp. TaxID=2910990 RepID=UPI00263744E3|nr:hypothetical protein [Solidesulfovibrio sp.]